jgi:hypothetical protein
MTIDHVVTTGNARALADEGQPATQRPLKSPVDADASTNNITISTSLQPPPSPNRRHSLTPGGTTKVLADLQAGVINARNALENTKAQLRLSQRSVAQLTRQTEDLKEGRERLRLENEGLNNVVARKERLLQEVCGAILFRIMFYTTPGSRASTEGRGRGRIVKDAAEIRNGHVKKIIAGNGSCPIRVFCGLTKK